MSKFVTKYHVRIKMLPRLRSHPEVTSAQTQVQGTQCVPRPKLQGLEFGSSAQ